VARVLLTAPADADTAGIIAYLAGKAGHNIAARYVASFEKLYDRLADHPDNGAPRPALGPHVRIGIVSPYIVIYEHDATGDAVIVLRIVHGRRKITGDLLLANIGSL
jgi:toxin ParE1/3/4